MDDHTAHIIDILHSPIEGSGGTRLYLECNARRLSDTGLAEHYADKITAEVNRRYTPWKS